MAYARLMGPADEELDALRRYGGAQPGAGQAAANLEPSPAAQPSGASPSGTYTNFDRLYSANKDAAEATARRVREGVEGNAQKAQAGLGGLQSAFGQAVNAGSLQAQPSPQDRQAATGGGLQAMTTPRPTQGAPGTATGSYHGQPGSTVDQWRKYSQTKYSGPDDLEALNRYGGATGQYDKVARDTRDAQSQLNNTATQSGREALMGRTAQPGGYTQRQREFDAGLVGAAGGKDFEATRARYGDLERSLTDANAASRAMADRARAFTEQAAKGYGGLVSDYEKATAPKGPTAVGSVGPGGVHSTGKTPKKPAWETWDTSVKGKAATTVTAAGKMFDPLSWFDAYDKAGVQDPWDKAGEIYRGATGQEMGLHPMMTQAVYNSMSDEEWAAFQQMAPDDQLAFIKERERKLGGV